MRFCLFADSSVLRTKGGKNTETLLHDPQFPSVSEHCTSLSSSIPLGAAGLVPPGLAVPSVLRTPHCKCCLLSCLVSTAPRSPFIPSCLLFQETPTLGQLRKYTHISQRHRFSSSSCHKGNITIKQVSFPVLMKVMFIENNLEVTRGKRQG